MTLNYLLSSHFFSLIFLLIIALHIWMPWNIHYVYCRFGYNNKNYHPLNSFSSITCQQYYVLLYINKYIAIAKVRISPTNFIGRIFDATSFLIRFSLECSAYGFGYSAHSFPPKKKIENTFCVVYSIHDLRTLISYYFHILFTLRWYSIGLATRECFLSANIFHIFQMAQG